MRYLAYLFFVFLLFPFSPPQHSADAAENTPSKISPRVEESRRFMAEGNSELALQTLFTALKKAPKSFDLHQEIVRVYADQGKEQQALDYLTAQMNKYPEENYFIFLRGAFLIQQGYLISATEDLLEAESNGLTTYELYSALFEIFSSVENNKEAYRYLNKSLVANPEADEKWHRKSLYDFSRNPALAFESINKAIALEPENPDYIYLKSYFLERSQRFEQAKHLLERATLSFPSDVRFLKLLLQVYEKGGFDNSLARQYLKQFLDNHQQHAQAYFFYAVTLVEVNELSKAQESLEKSLSINPNLDSSRLMLAKLLWHLKQYDQGTIHLEILAERNVADIFIYNTLASYYNSRNSLDRAEQIIFQGIYLFAEDQDVSEDNPELLFEYALIQEKKRNYNSAIELYLSLLEKIPDNHILYAALGRTLSSAERYEVSRFYLQKALKINDTSDIRTLLVYSYMREGEYEKSLEAVLTLLLQNDENSWAYSQQAYALYQLGKNVDALGSINKALVLDPINIAYKQIEASILKALGEYKQAEKSLQEALKLNDSVTLQTERVFLTIHFDPEQAQTDILWILREYRPFLKHLELFYYLNGLSDILWGFSSPSDPEKILYEHIIYNRFTKAQDLYQRLLIESPTKKLPYLHFLLQQFQDITLDLQENVPLDPFKPDPTDNPWKIAYQAFYFFDKDFQKSINLFLKVQEINSDFFWIDAFLGSLYQRLQEHDKAIPYYQKFLKHFPENTWAEMQMALLYDLTKQAKMSEKLYLRIIARKPNATVLNNLAWLYLTTTDQKVYNLDKALEYAREAVSLQPHAANLDTLAEALYQKKLYQEAFDLIERAILQDQSNLDHFKKQKRKIQREIDKQTSN